MRVRLKLFFLDYIEHRQAYRTGVEKCWLSHPNYIALSHRAVRLLWDLYIQYNGHNNGDFTVAYSVMRKKGWNSNDQIRKGIRELIQTCWIVLTRQGGMNNGCNLYAVTFHSIDYCKGKLDVP